MKAYVASSLFNAEKVQLVQKKLQELDFTITYDWTTHGQLTSVDDLTKVGMLEEQGVKDCDLFFMIHPARNGTHCELGMARVLNKHIVILEDGVQIEQKTFYYRPEGHLYPINKFIDLDKALVFAAKLLAEHPKWWEHKMYKDMEEVMKDYYTEPNDDL